MEWRRERTWSWPFSARAWRSAFGVDGGFHGKPDAQRVIGEIGCIDLDAHRHALDDLDPVSRRVLRRDQRERRAGAAGETSHTAVEHHIGAVEVGNELHLLPDAHLAKLHLLEV